MDAAAGRLALVLRPATLRTPPPARRPADATRCPSHGPVRSQAKAAERRRAKFGEARCIEDIAADNGRQDEASGSRHPWPEGTTRGVDAAVVVEARGYPPVQAGKPPLRRRGPLWSPTAAEAVVGPTRPRGATSRQHVAQWSCSADSWLRAPAADREGVRYDQLAVLLGAYEPALRDTAAYQK